MRRSPFIQSSASALLFRPVISWGSIPGYSARMFQSSSALRTILKVTFAFAMQHYAGNVLKREATLRRALRSRLLFDGRALLRLIGLPRRGIEAPDIRRQTALWLRFFQLH
jgi:hypothetical protein